MRREMATPPDRSRKVNAGVHSLGSVRRQMEEAMGKLDIMEKEATPRDSSGNENMFVAELESQSDQDRVWEGSPWMSVNMQ